MKLKNVLFFSLAPLAFCSCNAIYDDLDACPHGADVSLTYTRNMQAIDKYDTDVDCAKLLLFDGSDDFVGEYEYEGARIVNLELPVGDYKAIVYGGMSCDDTDFLFTTTPGSGLKYDQVETYLSGTRTPESSRKLHEHFHGLGSFTVEEEDMHHRPVTIDLTKNTNSFNVSLSYSDKSPINASEYKFELIADNHVSNHENQVQKQGTPVTYRPHDITTEGNGEEITAHLSTPRLTLDRESKLRITKSGETNPVIDISILQYIEQMHHKAMPGSSLQEYLDCEDIWNFEFVLQPEDEKIVGLSFKINNWIVIINNWDL